MAKKIVIALGGNALGNDCLSLELVKETIKIHIGKVFVEEGYQVIIGHGNGQSSWYD